MITFSPDKFGFYTVGNYKTYSKYEAIELHRITGTFPEWNFNREVFDNINWKQEPKGNLYELYKERARQIRQAYDYVVLWYSGGADSHNMVAAWNDAGCKIDEIATYWNYDGSKNADDLMNAEPSKVVFPQIKQLQKEKNIKFRLVDISEMYLDVVRKYDLLYNMNGCLGVSVFARYLIRDKVEEYKNMISSGKKLCFLWGLDKPRINYDNNYYIQFLDMFDTQINSFTQDRYKDGWYDEMFYWTPDFTDIIVKQAHIIKNFLNTVNDQSFYQDTPTSAGFNPQIKKYLKMSVLKTLIYPKWDNSTFSNGKNPNRLYSLRDTWFWSSNLEEKEKLNTQILKYLNTMGTFWLNDPGDFTKGNKRHTSPKYYI